MASLEDIAATTTEHLSALRHESSTDEVSALSDAFSCSLIHGVHMRSHTLSHIAILLALSAAASAQQQELSSAAFDVVSIRLKTVGAGNTGVRERPDGSITMTNVRVDTLISRAYPPFVPLDMVGLPGWTRSDQYDVSATSSLKEVTPADRAQMMRALLAERFNLVTHIERRSRRVYALTRVRDGGELGPRLTRGTEVDCFERTKADRAAADAAWASGTAPPPTPRADSVGRVPPCAVRRAGAVMEGDISIGVLASLLRQFTRERDAVVDRTGLTGNYHFVLEFDPSDGRDQSTASFPSVFAALQEQLGLKLSPVNEEQDVLVIDRLDPPTEN